MSTVGKPIKCRAAVVWKKGEQYSIENVEVAPPRAGEVRVRMKSSGICHSDLHILKGCIPDWPFPAVLGHEGAGVVEDVGEGVVSVRPGDVVVLVFEGYCGECAWCKDDRTNACKNQQRDMFYPDGSSRITCKGQQMSQMNLVSTFSEFTCVPEKSVAKVNAKGNPNELCLAGCCIPTGYGAVRKTAQVPKGATCAVWGLGGVGMCVVMGCRDAGASRVIGIDTNPGKFPLAKELGCTDVLNPKDVSDLPKTLAEMTNGGVDFCFVSVGNIAAMEQAFTCSHSQWGTTVVIGLADQGESMRADIWSLLYGRKLIGSSYGGYKAKLEIPKLVEKVLSGQIQLEKLISHRIPLDDINEGYRMLVAGESLRAIIDFDLKA